MPSHLQICLSFFRCTNCCCSATATATATATSLLIDKNNAGDAASAGQGKAMMNDDNLRSSPMAGMPNMMGMNNNGMQQQHNGMVQGDNINNMNPNMMNPAMNGMGGMHGQMQMMQNMNPRMNMMQQQHNVCISSEIFSFL